MATKGDTATASQYANLHDPKAEQAALGSLLLDPAKVAPILARLVSVADFYDDGIGQLVVATIDLQQAGKPVADPVLLMAEWKKLGLGQHIDLAGMMRLATEVPHTAHAQYYAERIRDLAKLRNVVAIADQLKTNAIRGEDDCESILGWLNSKVLTLQHGASSDAQLIGDVMNEVVNDYEARLKSGNKGVLLSGFPAADERGFVFAPGELTVLAARTSMGKTTLATQIGMYHANKGRQVLMASLEMKSTEVAGRLLAAASGNNHQAMRMGQIDHNTIQELREAATDVGDTPFRLWSPGRVKVGQIHAMASLCKSAHGLSLVIVDLLQCVRYDDHGDPEHIAYGKITKGIRDIAQQLAVPVILIAQLNRGAEGERPTLSNLKGSGAIEEDADVVALLHSAARASEDVELIIEKNRFGTPGSVTLKFIPHQTRFADPTLEIEHSDNYRPEFGDWNNR